MATGPGAIASRSPQARYAIPAPAKQRAVPTFRPALRCQSAARISQLPFNSKTGNENETEVAVADLCLNFLVRRRSLARQFNVACVLNFRDHFEDLKGIRASCQCGLANGQGEEAAHCCFPFDRTIIAPSVFRHCGAESCAAKSSRSKPVS